MSKIKYREGFEFVLAEDYTIFTGICPPKSFVCKWAILSINGWLTILHDYPWNGANKPGYNTKGTMRGSLVHDVLYELIRLVRMGVIKIDWTEEMLAEWKVKADDLLHDILVEDGMVHFMAEVWEEAVENFGGSCILIEAQPPVLEAP
jgi:hypothetical protein